MNGTKSQRPPPPYWIYKTFIEDALNSTNNGSRLAVEAVTVDYANKDGSGFMSHLFRVVATIRRGDEEEAEEMRFVVKCEETEGKLQNVTEENQVFVRESLVLSEVVPEAHRLLQPVEGAQFRPLAACCHLSGRLPARFLLLEDLVAAGFRMAPAGSPLDLDHCRVVLRAYARFHAGSARVLRDNPDYTRMDVFDARITPSEAQLEFFRNLGDRVFKAVAKELRTADGYQQYADKYERLAPRNVADTCRYWATQEVVLPVMLHSDCWKNNFMFKYEGSKVVEARLLDFQFSKVHNPAPDLVYFLFANCSEDTHRHHLDRLLEEYHATLIHLLRRLGMACEADAYPLDRLRTDMDAAAPLAVFFSAMTPIAQLSEKYGSDIASFLQSPDSSTGVGAMQEAYRSPNIFSYLKYLAPLFDSKGLL